MPKITEMYAFIAEDKGPEDEGITAMRIGALWMPLVTADMKSVDSLKKMVKEIATRTNTKITLARFSTRTDMETIEP